MAAEANGRAKEPGKANGHIVIPKAKPATKKRFSLFSTISRYGVPFTKICRLLRLPD